MMRCSALLLFEVLIAVTAVPGQDVSKPPDKPPPVIELPLPPSPKPPPSFEENHYKLGPDVICDVKCHKDCKVLVHPEGAVRITKEVVPAGQTFRQKGKFIDGKSYKTWKGPVTVLMIESNDYKSGVCVDIIPYGFLKDDEVKSIILDVDDGRGPRPPPPDPVNPIDPPKPKPEPEPARASKVTVLICENLIERTVAQARVIDDPEFRKSVKDTGGTVQLVSSKDLTYIGNRYNQYAEKVGLPAVIVFDADAVGPSAPLTYFKLPDTAADLKARIGKVVKK